MVMGERFYLMKTAQSWNSRGVRWPQWGSPGYNSSGITAELQCCNSTLELISGCCSSRGETQASWKLKVHFIEAEVKPLAPDWSILMRIRNLNPHSLIGPKGIAPIGQNGASLIGRCRCWWGNMVACLLLDKECLNSIDWNTIPETPS